MSNKCESARGQRALTDERENITGVEQISLFDLHHTHDGRISQLAGELEELNEALKHGDPNVDSGWLDAYERYLAVSDELIRLKAGGAL